MLSSMLVILMSFQSQMFFDSEDEWIAEGYEIVTELRYRISDYVDPYSTNENGVDQYFVEMCFDPDGDFKVGIQGSNNLVLIDAGTPGPISVPIIPGIEIRNIQNLIFVLSKYYSSDFGTFNKFISTIEYLSTRECPISWMMNSSGYITCADGSRIAFYDIDGHEMHSEHFPYNTHGGLPSLLNWSCARDGNLIVVTLLQENLVRAYDMCGNCLWEYQLDVQGGLMPVTVSDNGSTVCVSTTLNGCIILDNRGNPLISILNDDEYMSVESIGLSPNGEYTAITAMQCSPGAEPGDALLYLINISSETIEVTLLDSFSENYSPQVMDVTDDGLILCGLNRVSGDTGHRRGITDRRLAVIDRDGNYVWVSDITTMDSVIIESDNAVQPLSSYLNSIYGFKGTIYSNSIIEIGYLDLITGDIVRKSFSEIGE